ncbi:MAG TPA: hypothetical protein PLU30_21275 [Verrucomicrobiae bacterium]|nr:hypothetical protein [Verrucomicrobiae bacterium]
MAACSLKCEEPPTKGGVGATVGGGEHLAHVEGELESIYRDLDVKNKTIRALSESLELANAEADFFRRQWIDLRLRDEALGVDALTGDEARLREKVVAAVRDLYQSEKRRQETVAQLAAMVEMMQGVLKSARGIDAEMRAQVEAQLRLSQALIEGRGEAAQVGPGTLIAAQVLDYKPALNLAVLNVGRRQDAKVGMVFEIMRGGRLIAMARAVDVRESILGAIVERSAERTVVAAGDDARVSTVKSQILEKK